MLGCRHLEQGAGGFGGDFLQGVAGGVTDEGGLPTIGMEIRHRARPEAAGCVTAEGRKSIRLVGEVSATSRSFFSARLKKQALYFMLQ